MVVPVYHVCPCVPMLVSHSISVCISFSLHLLLLSQYDLCKQADVGATQNMLQLICTD